MQDRAGELRNHRRGWTITLMLAVAANPSVGDHPDEGLA
jgi:hypothetical protein